MRKVFLLHNPTSGRKSQRMRELIVAVAGTLRAAGAEVTVEATRHLGSAAAQVRELIPHGFDSVFVAGGDGTINDALQGMIPGEAALGVIPMGTGNVLAHDLGLPMNPLKAVECLLKWKPRRIAVGRMEFTRTQLGASGETDSRWFLSVAGVGGSAALMYDTLSTHKGGLGMAAYYLHMLKLAAFHDFPSFKVEYLDQHGNFVQRTAVEADAVRVGNFGGLMRRWAWGANLARHDAQLVIFPSSNRLHFVHYTLARILDTQWKTPGVEMVHTTQVRCTPIDSDTRLHAAADGEHLGGLPVKIEIVPNMLNLLMPVDAES